MMNDEHDDDRETTLLGAIRHVIDSLVDAEREGRSGAAGTGRIPKGHFTTQYGFSGQIGRSESAEDGDDGASTRRTEESPYLVDVRYDEEDEELLVIADLPEVDADDLTVGLDRDRDQLVIGVEDRPVERIELPWPVADVESGFRHGVLELRFTPEEGER
jgi:HSP20 family molecular chaperone IbpA